MPRHLWIGLLAGVAVALATPAVAQQKAPAAKAKKKKPSKCKDGEPLTVAKFTYSQGPNLPAAVNASLTGKPGDTKAGLKVMVHRRLGNCLACHVITKVLDMAKTDKWLGGKKSLPLYSHGELGPPLDGLASRYSEGEIRALIIDPKKVFPDTIMPSFHRNTGFHRVIKDCKGRAMLTAQRVEDIVAYLMTLK